MLKPLFPAFNVATLHMANRVNPRGWRVSADAPDTLAKLKARAKRDGIITIERMSYDVPLCEYIGDDWFRAAQILNGTYAYA